MNEKTHSHGEKNSNSKNSSFDNPVTHLEKLKEKTREDYPIDVTIQDMTL